MKIQTFKVWCKDGFCRLVNAENKTAAARQAINAAREEGWVSNEATTPVRIECLTGEEQV